jgi:hypothetical protein
VGRLIDAIAAHASLACTVGSYGYRPRRRRTGVRPERDAFDVARADKRRLFSGAGTRSGIRPADLVGAIAGETGVPGTMLGPIKIAETFSLVDVPEEFAAEIIGRMKNANLRASRPQSGAIAKRRARDSLCSVYFRAAEAPEMRRAPYARARPVWTVCEGSLRRFSSRRGFLASIMKKRRDRTNSGSSNA